VAQSPYEQIQLNSGNEEIPTTVIDSFQTVKSSFYNALSTATSVLTVDAAIIEEPDEE
jgi:chaperonin GroEL (HSP60 family)